MSIHLKLPAIAAALLLTNCATIIKRGGTQELAVDSQPSGLSFVVTKPGGEVVASGRTPQSVKLDTGAGYFSPATYTIEVKRGGRLVGTHQVTSTISGWYFGNIAFGGLIGMLAVDPVTGAMYSLPKTVTVSGTATASHDGRSLKIASTASLTPAQRAQLTRI